ncbi:sensor histidine kinase [Alteromonas sp. RKMC-009]|uniref:sensor histidine kinase n=1 Tax=Alteromonas sp. RKMC-009 TaxID=2267264 RepID=UPI000E683A9C|nr:sensor histidine kinase [Alteromonas sp. RKMC-009]AYA64106.1 histidine kinase [Alteromonas sp. RKMC-009]
MLNKVVQSAYSWITLVTVVIVIITGNAFYVVSTLDELASLESRLFSTNRVINAINKLHMAVLRAESGQRGYLLTKDEAYLTDYTITLNKLNELLEEVEAASVESDLPEQEDNIEDLIDLSKAKINELIKTVELTRAGEYSEALSMVNTDLGLSLYDEFDLRYDRVDATEREAQVKHLDSLMRLRSDSVTTLIISGITTGLLIIAILILLRLNLRETVKHQRDLEEYNEELEDKIEGRTQELKLYADELSRSNRELEDFAFVASHDLQEPLRKIRAFGNRLEAGYADVMDERGRDFLQRMLNAAERMSMLISDLLAFSRVTTRGKDFSEVALSEILDNVTSDLEIAIEESKATINAGSLPVVQCDKTQIEQLLLNLMSNALKFRSEDTPPVISLNSRPSTEEELEPILLKDEYEWVTITVEDNGIGFEQSFAEKIFAPFQRLHGRSAYKGTGIGLAVCRRIVERHNGVIKAFSEPGKGSRFVITMPVNGEPFATNSEGVVKHVS